VIDLKMNYLPNVMARFCTEEMKMNPIFYWWHKTIGEPVDMRIGFRASEMRRAKRVIERLDKNKLDTYNATFKKKKGRNVWEEVKWRTVSFPLIDDKVYKDTIENFWKDRFVRFAEFNNCVGCFHRNPVFLNKMAQHHRNKMEWFNSMEIKTGNQFKKEAKYSDILKYKPQIELSFDDFSECDSGYCGL
jgi:hypothetical protein